MSKAKLVLQEPNERQKLFLAAKKKHVGYGGARGGGKSWAVRDKAKRLCLRFHGIKILIVRRTYPELVNNHINQLREELNNIAIYNKSEKVFRFENGSTINFGYCNCDNDLLQYQGAEYDVVFLDEATQLREEWIRKITACVRGVNSFPKRIYYTCNPGGVSHAYIKRLFIDKKYKNGEKAEDYEFIYARVTDNKALMDTQPDYVQQLEALPAKLRKAWLEGDWNIFEGQVFEEFSDDEEHYNDRRFTHVINPFEIPRDWIIYRSFDWGYARPFACGWYAVDTDGVAYRICEYYGCTGEPNEGVKKTPSEVFAEIHRIETEHPWLKGKNIIGIADPAIWNAEKGESIADTAANYQVYFQKGDHQRIAGLMQCHYRFHFDENGQAMFYVFKNCKEFIRTIPALQYDETKVEDVDTDGCEDHIYDEFRYFCMCRPISAPVAEKTDTYKNSALYHALEIPKEMLSTPRPREHIEIIRE